MSDPKFPVGSKVRVSYFGNGQTGEMESYRPEFSYKYMVRLDVSRTLVAYQENELDRYEEETGEHVSSAAESFKVPQRLREESGEGLVTDAQVDALFDAINGATGPRNQARLVLDTTQPPHDPYPKENGEMFKDPTNNIREKAEEIVEAIAEEARSAFRSNTEGRAVNVRGLFTDLTEGSAATDRLERLADLVDTLNETLDEIDNL